MTLDELDALQKSGEFHHATYRDIGTIWEGLWIYRKYNGLRGFEPAGAFLRGAADLDAAHAMVRQSGISVGSYGQG